MDTIELEAQPRDVLGKKVRLLRRQGLVPANLYGRGRDSAALQLPEKLVSQRVARASRSTLFSLSLDKGGSQTVLVKDVQRHPTSGRVLHVDFYQVDLTEKLKTSVPLHFVGEAPAVKQFSGSLLHNLSAVDVEALPADLPTSIEVDVSGLKTLDDTLLVSDLKLPGGVELFTPGEEMIARVIPPGAGEEVEAEEAEEAAEAAEEGAAAEGEGPAQASADDETKSETSSDRE